LENLHLIAGLGNPGPEYAATRHNIGFVLVERLAAALEGRLEGGAEIPRPPGQGLERGGERVILCQPQTFMNESGEAVGAWRGFTNWPRRAF
jgi:PTH1 family peptidyl-tRNA hydrolase